MCLQKSDTIPLYYFPFFSTLLLSVHLKTSSAQAPQLCALLKLLLASGLGKHPLLKTVVLNCVRDRLFTGVLQILTHVSNAFSLQVDMNIVIVCAVLLSGGYSSMDMSQETWHEIR